MFDWNDLKAFLAVARGGSTLAAAKLLGVNQTTVARRIESLEGALALKLFERGQSGSRLTEAGRDLQAEAEKVERVANAFESRAQAHQRGLAGAIRVTCIEMMANMTLTPAIAEFRQRYPEVHVDLIISDQQLDIEAGEADLAIRSGTALQISNLVARKLGDYTFCLYCSRDYAARKGLPASPAALADHDLIGGDAGLERMPGIIWMLEQAPGRPPASRSNSLTNMVHAVAAGLGVAPLPCIIADADANLLRCSEPIEAAMASAWIVTRRELKDTPRVRAFIDFLVPFIQQDAKRREAFNRSLRAKVAANDTGGTEAPARSSPA
ncbi:LysR family transcriptional regulator [Phenylobacterium sp.]|jgi:DNA-binding transcriptional LysR family regulator|uniref:LysR family transcriptional regulator n=1 Tax=Phenylobacterium sp. TaxID=1871053 RepID=UPI002E3053F0|nr:LysR family transcriptional regulator [Phenylobacterium sp.]HEX4711088.1 LysR family transcriptional regulator [Phenylobacterium sp.]